MAYLKALVAPLVNLHYTWHNLRIDNLYKIEHTGQICYLRGSLNDFFDPVERRIYITNGVERDGVFIATEAENYDVWIATEAEDETLWLTTESENVLSGLDYIVWVPQALYDNQLPDITAHIDFYRVAGKRYAIFVINE
jgi:hypothetical protein